MPCDRCGATRSVHEYPIISGQYNTWIEDGGPRKKVVQTLSNLHIHEFRLCDGCDRRRKLANAVLIVTALAWLALLIILASHVPAPIFRWLDHASAATIFGALVINAAVLVIALLFLHPGPTLRKRAVAQRNAELGPGSVQKFATAAGRVLHGFRPAS